jgi:hypothetical protein
LALAFLAVVAGAAAAELEAAGDDESTGVDESVGVAESDAAGVFRVSELAEVIPVVAPDVIGEAAALKPLLT